jgi:hypothetical protein
VVKPGIPLTISEFIYAESIYIQNNETVLPQIQVNITGIAKIYNNTDALFFDAKFVTSEENGLYVDTIFPYKTNSTFFSDKIDQDPLILEFLVNNQSVIWEASPNHSYSIWLANLTNPFHISINQPVGINFQKNRRRGIGDYSINSSFNVIISVALNNPSKSSGDTMLSVAIIIISIIGAVAGLTCLVYFRHFFRK